MELVGDNLLQYKRILFDTMKAFIAFCDQNNLVYYACAGTTLGAVRHHGIIPWDDDIDVMMPRVDYEMLKKLSHKLKGTDYEILSYDNTSNYGLFFLKFSNKRTTIWERKSNRCIIGVFIDIFPIDEVFNINESKSYFRQYNSLFNKMSAHRNNTLSDFAKKYKFRGVVSFLLYSIFSFYYRIRFDRLVKTVRQIKGEKRIIYGGYYSFEKELCNKEWLGNGRLMPFEDFEIRVPERYEDYLTNLYGDYMQLPPIESRKSHHHHYFYDLSTRRDINELKKLSLEEDDVIVKYV